MALGCRALQSGLNNNFSAWRGPHAWRAGFLLGDSPLKIMPVAGVRTKAPGWKLNDKALYKILESHVYRCEAASSNKTFPAWTHFLHFEMAAAKLPAVLRASIDGTKVSYTQLGSSGLRVSVPILGAMSLGSQKWQDWVVEGEEALQVLKSAWDKGMVFAQLHFLVFEKPSDKRHRTKYMGHS